MARAPAPKQMACLVIGYQRLLLPLDKAMTVVNALQGAAMCEYEYHRENERYRLSEQSMNLEMTLVPASKIIMPSGSMEPHPAAPRVRRIAAT